MVPRVPARVDSGVVVCTYERLADVDLMILQWGNVQAIHGVHILQADDTRLVGMCKLLARTLK